MLSLEASISNSDTASKAVDGPELQFRGDIDGPSEQCSSAVQRPEREDALILPTPVNDHRAT